MADINPAISIMTLNVNELNNTKSEVDRVGKKYTQDPTTCSLQKTYLRYSDTNGLKVKGWQKIYRQQPYGSWSDYTDIKQSRL